MTESTARSAIFQLQSTISPNYTWAVAQKPVCVRIPFPVIDRLEQEAVENFKSLSSRGSEIGGLLYGLVSPGQPAEVTIEDYELISCDYSRGPLYRLADADMARFDRAIQQHGAGSSLAVVGMFRSNTRKGLSLDAEDITFFDSRFRDPHQIALLIRPFATKASTAGIFIREAGVVQGETSYLEFPFRSSLLSSEKPNVEGPESKSATTATGAAPASSVSRTAPRGQIVPIASRRESSMTAEPTVEEELVAPTMTAHVATPPVAAPVQPAPQTPAPKPEDRVAAPAPKPEEKVVKAPVEDKVVKPKPEDKAAKPQVDDKAIKPKPEEKTSKPQVDNAVKPKQEEKIVKPQVDDKAAKPKVEDRPSKPQVDARSAAKPKQEEKANKPQVEDKLAKPQAEVKPAPAKLAAAAVTAPAPAPSAAPEIEPAPGKGKMMWIGIGVGVILILVVAFFAFPALVHRNQPTGSPQDSSALSLRVERTAGEILLTWNRDSDPIRSATHAVLSIQDGDQHENVEMDLAQLRNGSISYSPASSDVVFKMEVTGKGQEKTASESVRVLRTKASPLASPETPAAQQQAAAPTPAKPTTPTPSTPAASSPTPTATPAANNSANNSTPSTNTAPEGTAEETTKAPERQLKPFQAPSLSARLHPVNSADLPDAPSMSGGVQTSSSVPTVTGLNMNSSAPVAPARPGAPPAPAAATPTPDKKNSQGGQLVQAQLVSKKDPEYPKLARETGAKGIVELVATIGTDGKVKAVKVVKGPPMLQKAASDAVLQWRYKPTMLNGVAVEAQTQVFVNFLGGDR